MKNTIVRVPDPSLIMLVGAAGCGKSTFAKKHFSPTEVIASDHCRALVSDDESNQACTPDAFAVLHCIADKRLKAGKMAVIDATNVKIASRKSGIQLAKRHHVPLVAIVLDMPYATCLANNKKRRYRRVDDYVIWAQRNQLHASLTHLERHEGIAQVHVLHSIEEVDAVMIQRHPIATNQSHESGPFDIIGDVHGCFEEMYTLLKKLGYTMKKQGNYVVSHPAGRRIVFVGDLVDRGPDSPEVLRFVMDATASGMALCVNGNHDDKLRRKLMGRNVAIKHGLQETLDQLAQTSDTFQREVLDFLNGLVSHILLDAGKLAVTHAGVKETYLGRTSPRIRVFCMYGDITGERDAFGLPVRRPWAHSYHGKACIVYGHTPIAEPEWCNNTINIDTGCVFGGRLTALRYPERTWVSVKARQVYCSPIRPLSDKPE